MSTGSQYLAAAYAVVLLGLLLYVVVVGMRTARTTREAEVLSQLVERDEPGPAGPARPSSEGGTA